MQEIMLLPVNVEITSRETRMILELDANLIFQHVLMTLSVLNMNPVEDKTMDWKIVHQFVREFDVESTLIVLAEVTLLPVNVYLDSLEMQDMDVKNLLNIFVTPIKSVQWTRSVYWPRMALETVLMSASKPDVLTDQLVLVLITLLDVNVFLDTRDYEMKQMEDVLPIFVTVIMTAEKINCVEAKQVDN